MNFVQLILINIYEESKGEINDLFFIYKKDKKFINYQILPHLSINMVYL